MCKRACPCVCVGALILQNNSWASFGQAMPTTTQELAAHKIRAQVQQQPPSAVQDATSAEALVVQAQVSAIIGSRVIPSPSRTKRSTTSDRKCIHTTAAAVALPVKSYRHHVTRTAMTLFIKSKCTLYCIPFGWRSALCVVLTHAKYFPLRNCEESLFLPYVEAIEQQVLYKLCTQSTQLTFKW